MNFLKRTFFIFIIFILLGLIFSLFLPSDFEVRKSAIIAADQSTVQQQLKGFKYQKIGVHQIEQENDHWSFASTSAGTEVVSSIKFLFGFNPITKFEAFFKKGELNKMFQHKFDSIVLVLEELPRIQGVVVERKKLENDIWFLSIRDTINPMNINNVYGKLYEEINYYLTTKGFSSSEPPLVIYHFWSDTLVDIEVGISGVDSSMVDNTRIKMNKIGQSDVVTAMHYGSYERMPETYFGINEWMRKNKVIVTGPPWEIYITDPSSEVDPKKWKTAIFFPIQ